MGIDKSNVRFVVHYDLPKNIESYYQETGRAGRDGYSSEALLLYGLQDCMLVKRLIENNENEDQKRIELHKLNCMTGLAEATTCRRQVLLNYFNESLEKGCGNCDICTDPPETYDATTDAQKALSCVYRVNQRYGVNHIIDILRGKELTRIKSLGHDQLSTHGIGKDMSQDQWHSIFRQLIHLGYLEQDIANYSVLKLTAQAQLILSGKKKLMLAPARVKIRNTKKANKPNKGRRDDVKNMDFDTDLFEILRQLRKSLSQVAAVPPFMVFSDASLVEMSSLLPRTEKQFLEINGVGHKKLERFGGDFLHAINSFISEKSQ